MKRQGSRVVKGQRNEPALPDAGGSPAGESTEHESALRGHMMMPAVRDHWRYLCRQAAGFERAREYASAEVRWREAAELSRAGVDRHWCESRAQWCLRVRLREDGES